MLEEESQLCKEFFKQDKEKCTQGWKFIEKSSDIWLYVYDYVLVIQDLTLLLKNQKDFTVQNVVYYPLLSVCSGIDL